MPAPSASRSLLSPPSSRPLLDPELIAAFRRERYLAAFAEATARHGYPKVTVGHVVALAHTSRNGFYQHFDNKEDAFLATLRWGFDALTGEIEEACVAAGADFPRRVRAALHALLGWLAANPALARVCLIDALAAGPEAAGLRLGFADLLAARLRSAAPPAPERLASTEEMLVGAVLTLLAYRLAAERASRLHSLIEPLAEFVLAPYRAAAPRYAAGLGPLAAPSFW